MIDVNSTFITLVPEVSEVKKFEDFRPISLFNVIYKVVAKAIANKLKSILPYIISSNQSTFVYSKLIIDNIFIVYETFHIMTIKCKGNNKFMILKLDISKTYDQVE